MASRYMGGSLLLMDFENYCNKRFIITHDSFVEMRGTMLREHNCQGIPVFSKEPFPIPAAWK